MAAYRAYAHAQARRDLPVLITGGAQGDYVPTHSGQFADGFPEKPEICSRLDLLIESLSAGSVRVGIDTETLPSPVRIPEDMQRFIDHDPEQVSALLIRRRQAPDTMPGRHELEEAVLRGVLGIGAVSQERIGHPHQLVMSRSEQRLGVAVRCLRHSVLPGSSVRAARPYGAGIPPQRGWADPGQPGAA